MDNVSRTGGNETVLQGVIPTTLLEAVIPGYGIIHEFLYRLGFDTTLLVFLVILVLVIRTGSVWSVIWSLISAEVSIDDEDQSFLIIQRFLSKLLKGSRRLKAETPVMSVLDARNPESKNVFIDGEAITVADFSSQSSKSQFRFTLATGYHIIRFGHTYILINVIQSRVTQGTSSRNKHIITLMCIGRSAAPLQKLLNDALDDHYNQQRGKTVIMSPASLVGWQFGKSTSWVQLPTKINRAVDTVILESKLKCGLIRDIHEFLTAFSSYASQGIPYRRGYLLYGPPGTGKTSMILAVAALFGLEIYVVNLGDKYLTDEALGQLLNSLPARCILLFEDVDAIGLNRDAPKSKEDENTGITLSGLLNAIDGVWSHEGRVLMMTTNKPDDLDKALIRPGRVDYKIEFTNATTAQIRGLFLRRYNDNISQPPQPLGLSTDSQSMSKLTVITAGLKAAFRYAATHIRELVLRLLETPAVNSQKSPAVPKTNKMPEITLSSEQIVPVTEHILNGLAEAFCKAVPDGKFSPAEIQEFLRGQKSGPHRACDDVEGWVRDMNRISKDAPRANFSVVDYPKTSSVEGNEKSLDIAE